MLSIRARRTTRPVAFATALLVFLVAPAVASAARPHPVGKGTIHADGERYAVFLPAVGGAPTVIDTKTGTSWKIAEQPGYWLHAIGGGRVLWVPDDPPYYDKPPLLTDVFGADSVVPPGWQAVVDEPDPNRYAELVGREWIGVRRSGNHYNLFGYLNWHTGRWISLDTGPATSWPNLDRPELMEPVCNGIARRRLDEYDNEGWSQLDFRHPYVTYVRGNRVLAARCGSPRTTTLFRYSEKPCEHCVVNTQVSLDARRPVWMGPAKRAALRAYLPRKRRVVTVARMRRGPSSYVFITQTRTRIFVQLRDSRVYWLPPPRG